MLPGVCGSSCSAGFFFFFLPLQAAARRCVHRVCAAKKKAININCKKCSAPSKTARGATHFFLLFGVLAGAPASLAAGEPGGAGAGWSAGDGMPSAAHGGPVLPLHWQCQTAATSKKDFFQWS